MDLPHRLLAWQSKRKERRKLCFSLFILKTKAWHMVDRKNEWKICFFWTKLSRRWDSSDSFTVSMCTPPSSWGGALLYSLVAVPQPRCFVGTVHVPVGMTSGGPSRTWLSLHPDVTSWWRFRWEKAAKGKVLLLTTWSNHFTSSGISFLICKMGGSTRKVVSPI
jgi:hypothetical protein